jgi:hypothetical protein
VSGQATAAAPAVRARTAAPPRPLRVPPRPRRVSGPARREGRERPAQRRSEGETGLALGVLAALQGLSRHRSLGGRTWIALVAFALIGIVTLQLGLLKLNAGIGRALEHEALLQRENAALSIEDSELAASDRVTSQAVRLGMELIPAGALRFLQARPRTDPARAAAALSTPARAPTTGSGEASGPGAPAVTSSSPLAEPSSTGAATTSASSESSTTTSGSAERASAGSATTSPSSEPPASSSGEPSQASGESTSPSATASPSAAPAAGSPAEGAPGGGTRAGASG